MPDPESVLVICTGNSCRSIMGEALINQLGKGRYKAFSAGSRPAGYVHLKALETLRRHGIDPSKPSSKSLNDFTDTPIDLVITVCDQAAGETCPLFQGSPKKLHWSIPDPAYSLSERTEKQEDTAFEQAFSLLKKHIEKELL